MSKTAKRTNEKMWKSIVASVKSGSSGGRPGQWSARKAQIATKRYKKRGGGYKGAKKADAAYLGRNFKIAIEIETGTNKLEQIGEKLDWLKKTFNYIVFVTPKKYIPKYAVFADNKQVFVLTIKKAREKVLDWICPI